MFSTVDRPSWRFLRAYLVGDSSEIVIGVDRLGLEPELYDRIRTMPTPALLSEVGRDLAARRWATHDFEGVQAVLRALSPPARDLTLSGPFSRRLDATDPTGDPEAVARSPTYPTLVALPLRDGETSDSELAFTHVRLEAWRIRFRPTDRSVAGERIASVDVQR